MRGAGRWNAPAAGGVAVLAAIVGLLAATAGTAAPPRGGGSALAEVLARSGSDGNALLGIRAPVPSATDGPQQPQQPPGGPMSPGMPSGSSTEPSGPAGSGAIALGMTDIAGQQVLADGQGRPVYAYSGDKTGRDGACDDRCAQMWPRVLGPASAGNGMNAAALGSFRLADGGEQVTYYGDPLYYFSGDTQPGQALGTQVEDWFLVTADGKWRK